MKKIKNFFDKLNNSKCYNFTMMVFSFVAGYFFSSPIVFFVSGFPPFFEALAELQTTLGYYLYPTFFVFGYFSACFIGMSFEYLGRYKDIKNKEKEQN